MCLGRINHLTAVLTLAIASIGMSAQAADASIVIGKSVANVPLGASKGGVTEKLGQPFRKAPGFWVFDKPCLCTIGWKRNHVRSIDTLSKSQRSDKGIGPGASLEATMNAYPEARCFHPAVFGETSKKCVLRSPNGAETAFVFFEEDLPMRDVELRAP